MSRFVAIPGDRDAYEQAVHLAGLGLGYRQIAVVLADYHGLRVSPSALRKQCRRRGVPPRPHGRLSNLDRAA
jgi:hypothetical protein